MAGSRRFGDRDRLESFASGERSDVPDSRRRSDIAELALADNARTLPGRVAIKRRVELPDRLERRDRRARSRRPRLRPPARRRNDTSSAATARDTTPVNAPVVNTPLRCTCPAPVRDHGHGDERAGSRVIRDRAATSTLVSVSPLTMRKAAASREGKAPAAAAGGTEDRHLPRVTHAHAVSGAVADDARDRVAADGAGSGPRRRRRRWPATEESAGRVAGRPRAWQPSRGRMKVDGGGWPRPAVSTSAGIIPW